MPPNGAKNHFPYLANILFGVMDVDLKTFMFWIVVASQTPRRPNSWGGPYPFCCNVSVAIGIVAIHTVAAVKIRPSTIASGLSRVVDSVRKMDVFDYSKECLSIVARNKNPFGHFSRKTQ